MPATQRIVLLLILGLAVLLGSTFAGAQGEQAKGSGYEYYVADALDRKLGNEGWELVGVALKDLRNTHFLFRRPLMGDRTMWEARIEDVSPTDQKDLQACNGWEYVALINNGRSSKSEAYFKRPKP